MEPKVLQFGGGNFLRAFIDFLVDEMNHKAAFNGGVVIVKPTPKGDYEDLRQQNGQYHLWIRGMANGQLVNELKVIKCVSQVIQPYHDYHAYLDTATWPTLRFVVSNTTEAGIVFDANDSVHHQPALSFPGKLTQWLFARFQHFQGSPGSGCIFLPCELIEQNGKALEQAILSYIEHWNLPLAFRTWVIKENYFCNTLVDRIVPGFPSENPPPPEALQFSDTQIVTSEPYLFWAVASEEPQVSQELPLHQIGQNVVFTNDLLPFRKRKVRLLNGAHIVMVPLGLLSGVETVGDFMEEEC